jgi:hypothetical protein
MADLVNSSPGQCRLQRDSASQLSLQRYQGAYLPLKISGTWAAKLIPASGPTLSNSGLVAATLYYIYAFDNAGTLTLEASTTGHAVDATVGVEIKSGDATRTLVGVASMGAGTPGTFQPIGVGTLSWFNGSPEGVLGSHANALGSNFYGPVWKLGRPDLISWAWQNQGGASVVDAGGISFLTIPSQTTNMRSRLISAVGTPWTITTLLRVRHLASNNTQYAGLVFRESGTGKLYIYYILANGTIQAVKFTNDTTFSAVGAVNTAGPVNLSGHWHWLQITDDGTNLLFFYSHDGVNFIQLGSEGRTVFMAGGPNQYGIFGNVDSSAAAFDVSFASWVQS